MNKKIFRKVSLERLSSPEQLDELMQITTPKGWIALAAIVCILIMITIWGFFGEIPSKVMGQGMLIKTGGVFDIVSLGDGQITDILVKNGSIVEKGQVVAQIAQPDLEDEIQQAKISREELMMQHQTLVEFGSKDLKLQTEYLIQQRSNILSSIATAEQQLKWTEEKIKVQEDLLTQGLITKQSLLLTRQNYYTIKGEIEEQRNSLKQLSVNELTLKNQNQQALLTSQMKINETERHITQLENSLKLNAKVTSTYSGRILEIVANVGEVIRTGEPIFKLDLIGEDIKDLEAVLYVPPTDGKKIQVGMEVQISPTTVKQEEFGFMIGKVRSVADFPSTQQGIMRVFKNQELVNTLSGQGAPFEVYADLIVDPNTESGYRWSSSIGPNLKIHSGTLCSSSIIVRRQKPVSLVIPVLKGKLGI